MLYELLGDWKCTTVLLVRTEVELQSNIEGLQNGRLLNWKRPETLCKCFSRTRTNLEIIHSHFSGAGPETLIYLKCSAAEVEHYIRIQIPATIFRFPDREGKLMQNELEEILVHSKIDFMKLLITGCIDGPNNYTFVTMKSVKFFWKCSKTLRSPQIQMR